MKAVQKVFEVLLLLFGHRIFAHTVTLDYSGAEAALKLLKQAKVTKEEIDTLLTLKPYEKMFCWTKHNFGGAGLKEWREIFFYALNPNSAKPAFIEKSSGFLKGYFTRLPDEIRALKNNPAKTESHLNSVKTGVNKERIVQQATAFVRDNSHPLDFTVYFVSGLGQGVAYENFTAVDAAIMSADPGLTESLIAHEMYHCLRNNYSFQQKNKERCYDKLWQVLYWLEDEGIAELTTDSTFSRYQEICAYYKQTFPEMKERIDQHLAIYNKIDDYLQKFNDSLKARITGNRDFEGLEKVIQNMESHQIGHKMAFCIHKYLGATVLRNCSGKPKEFILNYQVAARKAINGYFCFDDEVVRFIESINTN